MEQRDRLVEAACLAGAAGIDVVASFARTHPRAAIHYDDTGADADDWIRINRRRPDARLRILL